MVDRLAWVTARAARGRDDDEPLALAALAAAGVRADVVDWDDPDVDWAGYDRAVLRSAWDYPERLPEFLAWLDVVEASTDLHNPAATVRWNVDKHYLAELDAAGVPVVPTTYAEPGDAPALPDGEFVVKPAVGAGSRDVASYGPDQHDAAREHVARLHARGASVMVQPLLASVARDGEWPLLFLGGTYSHAANKRIALPRAGVVDDLFAAERTAPHEADAEQLAVARAAVDVVTARFGVPTYARVDLVRDDAGRPCVLEVELVEPSLFLTEGGADAVLRLVAALIDEVPPVHPADLETVRESYDRVADAYVELGMGRLEPEPWLRAVLAAFAESVRGLGPVLDVGCGPGTVTAHLTGLGLDTSGVDLSPRMIEHARRQYPDLRFSVASATELDLAPASLGGVLGWWSLFNLPRDALPGVLRTFAAALVPGGHALIGTHVGDGDVPRTQCYGGLPVSWTTHLYRPEELAGLLVDAGLEVAAELRLPVHASSMPSQVLLAARRPA